MTAPVDHPLWPRVAGMKPRLRDHVQFYHHQYRGQPWHILRDGATTRCYRFQDSAYRIIRLLDGRHTVQAIRESLSAESRDEAASQEDLITLLGRLNAADMLQFDAVEDGADIFAPPPKTGTRKWLRQMMRPLALRIPLVDPERFLARHLSLVRPVFSPVGLFVWIFVVAAALVLGVSHSAELSAHWSARAMDPWNLVLLAITYPVVKVLHELGHAFATRLWGGEVHEMGVMLLVFMPLPYVDASAANAFDQKYKRMGVGAAGIMVEVFLAAIAIYLWLNVQPGLVRDIAFNVALIGGASTVLFNGNPLLRFDGYYILADAIEIPNLGPRSTQYLGYLAKRYLFGLHDAVSPVTARGERGWFVTYGIASFLYRLIISFAIALFVAGKFFVIGVVLAIWALGLQLLYPLMRYLGSILFGTALRHHRLRAIAVFGIAAISIIGIVFFIPLPSWTRAEGIIRMPEQSLVRADTDGFVVQLMKSEGQVVHKDEPLLEMEDPLLRAEIAVLKWRLSELEARYAAELLNDRVQAEIYKTQIRDVQTELAHTEKRFHQLTVHSPVEGTFVLPRSKDLPSRFVRKGDLLGYVADPSNTTARVVVPETAANLVRWHTESVEVRLPNRPGETIMGRIEREVPSATDHLPSPILGTQGGGTIAVDAGDEEGIRTIGHVFEFDVALPAVATVQYVGSRVYVRFNHHEETLARQWYRGLRQLFLAKLQV